MPIAIREGCREDLPRVLELIRELAEFEKASEQVSLTVEMMEKDGFGTDPLFGFYVAGNDHGKIPGMALYYYRYSTWKGKTLFLEDIIVSRPERGNGIGKALFERVIQKAQEEDCQRMSWQVLNWNEPAINFYKNYGAHIGDEWLNFDLYKDQLDKFHR